MNGAISITKSQCMQVPARFISFLFQLQPSDSEIIKENKKMVASAKDKAAKLNAVLLSVSMLFSEIR